MPTNKPAPNATVARRLLWLTQKLAHRADPINEPAPDHSLIADDARFLPGADPEGYLKRITKTRAVKEALLIADGGRTLIGWRIVSKITDEHSDGLRSPRLLDPEAAFVLDAALWYGGTVLFNKAPRKRGGELHYLDLFSGDDRVSARRALGDVPAGKIGTVRAEYQRDHRNLSVRTFGEPSLVVEEREAGRETQDTHRGREFLIAAALRLFDKNHAASGLPFNRRNYERLLRLGFLLVDELRAAEVSVMRDAAE